jgi:hypothetical protein
LAPKEKLKWTESNDTLSFYSIIHPQCLSTKKSWQDLKT